ncbi:hypothetical protein [Anaerospora hongkongensis]|uniref:VirB4 family type IV secretion/conjugal transfer ATPase n=1 Tax=Anaerospora hongkongensis TaxID=244830 RepID=UPI002FDA8B86
MQIREEITSVADKLPWGGLVHSAVVRNKDYSLMGFFQYTAQNLSEKTIPIQHFRNGWSLWTEKQHLPGQEDKYYMTLNWNPFYDQSNRIINTLNKKAISVEESIPYFYQTLQQLENSFSPHVQVQILKDDAIISYLRSTLCTLRSAPLTDRPLYLDALLSQDLQFTFRAQDLQIDGQTIGIVTPLGDPEQSKLHILFDRLQEYPYRFARRFLFSDASTYKRDQERYMDKWCAGRSSMLELIRKHLGQGQIFAYDAKSILFWNQDTDSLEIAIRQAETAMKELGIPCIIENYNLKDIFWGSLPGLFRANLTPPAVKLKDMTEIFIEKISEKENY